MNPDKRVVFIDLDKTLIRGHSQKLFMWYLLEKGLLRKRLCFKIALQYFVYELGLVDNFEGLRKDAFSMLKGISARRMNLLYDSFFRELVAPKFKKPMLNIIRYHKDREDILILITATMKEIAERVSKALGIHYTIATELEIKDGLYTGAILRGPIYADEKARLAAKFVNDNGLDLTESFAYTDHLSDLPLLFLVDNPVAVNPNPGLRHISYSMNWHILPW